MTTKDSISWVFTQIIPAGAMIRNVERAGRSIWYLLKGYNALKEVFAVAQKVAREARNERVSLKTFVVFILHLVSFNIIHALV